MHGSKVDALRCKAEAAGVLFVELTHMVPVFAKAGLATERKPWADHALLEEEIEEVREVELSVLAGNDDDVFVEGWLPVLGGHNDVVHIAFGENSAPA